MQIFSWMTVILFYFAAIEGFPTVVPDPIPCFLALERDFFFEPIVSQGLSLYNVRQELWIPINQLLRKKSVEIPQRMKERTSFMVPNPIEYPMQKGKTARILKEVLLEVFKEVMSEYRSYEVPNPDLIFDYIFLQRFPDFVRCFGSEVMSLKPKNV
ncbi:MAG: hypothetical protein ACH350_05630 [Parachlamydiaceae bacterium]